MSPMSPMNSNTALTEPGASRVLALPAAAPDAAYAYFLGYRLSCETDPYDVYHDVSSGITEFILVDARAKDSYEEECLPGARNLPHEDITDETLRGLDRTRVFVTYGWGPGCNAGSKAAAKLAAAGFRVKEMIGGLEYWKRQDFPTASVGR